MVFTQIVGVDISKLSDSVNSGFSFNCISPMPTFRIDAFSSLKSNPKFQMKYISVNRSWQTSSGFILRGSAYAWDCINTLFLFAAADKLWKNLN
jgi:hypothetical protein